MAWATAQDPRSPGAAPPTQQQVAGLPGPRRSLEMSPSSDEVQPGEGTPQDGGRGHPPDGLQKQSVGDCSRSRRRQKEEPKMKEGEEAEM